MSPANAPPAPASPLDEHLPAALRHRIEQRYWAPIGEAASVERFIGDPTLYAAPDRHPALFSDHGVVHVRDIATGSTLLADRLHGTLTPPRPPERQRFVRGLAVLLAYFHDIGMVESTPAGRRVHPQFAAQTVLGDDFDDLAAALWQADAGGLRSRLMALATELEAATGHAARPVPPTPLLAREAMAMALCHSKSAVPAPLLDDRAALRRLMLRACLTDLAAQQGAPLAQHAAHGRDPAAPSALLHRWADADTQAFAWLTDPSAPMAAFADDVVDAVRLLRAADALRQRGTTLRTSAGYEVCTDRATGQAVVGLHTTEPPRALLLRFDNPITAAEANIRATSMTADGHLCVEFYRGSFAVAGVRERLLAVTADVIADIEADALASFSHPAAPPLAQRSIRLSAPADDPLFADELAALTAHRHPRLAGRLQVVPGDTEDIPRSTPAWADDRHRLPDLDGAERQALFGRLAAHGLNVAAIDTAAALRGTRRLAIPAGTVLIEPGSPAHFVVLPLGPGLTLQPSGGYPAKALLPWMPVGVTGVARGGERNAAVVATASVELLLIDAAHYLAAWFRPYDLDGLRQALGLD